MHVFVRVDSSILIGSGHLMRCLTLAEGLRAKGADVVFICRDHPGNLCALIGKKGFTCHLLPRPTHTPAIIDDDYSSWIGNGWEADAFETKVIINSYPKDKRLLVIDHYGIDYRWEKMLRPFVDRIFVIDDLANRKHDCDFLLDQNLYEDMHCRYCGLVPANCRLFLGPAYALIRSEFRQAKARMKKRDGQIHRILIFFGGSDPTNETMKAIEAIELLGRPAIIVDVVVGLNNKNRESIEDRCRKMKNVNYYCQTENMAVLMAEADLAIGAGGITTWERCYMELPALVCTIAENQKKVAEYLNRLGIIKWLGSNAGVDAYKIAEVIRKLMNNPSMLLYINEKCRDMGVGSLNVSDAGSILP